MFNFFYIPIFAPVIAKNLSSVGLFGMLNFISFCAGLKFDMNNSNNSTLSLIHFFKGLIPGRSASK